ncbi:MAG: serine/threonine-protein phosphatase [Phycisphaerales bacterium]|nr:serine/threonine-protein phosphatase [Phycisphaerales bacterium]
MRIILTDQRDHSSREMEFNHAAVSLGSDSSNIVQLPSTTVPGFLAMIMPHHDEAREKWSYIPIDPSGQAMLHESPIAGQTELADGDELVVDRFRLRIEMVRVVELPAAEPAELKILQKVKEYPLPPGSDTQRAAEDVTLGGKLRKALMDTATRLGRAADFVQVIEAACQGVLPAVGARTAWMGLRRQASGRLEFVGGLKRDGAIAAEPAMLETFEYRCLQRGQCIRIIKPDEAELASAVVVPLPTRDGALGLLYVDTAAGERVLSPAEFDFIAAVAEAASVQVETLAHEQTVLRRAVSDAQVALLREVQARLDPVHVPVWPQLQLAAYTKPGQERGGDVYDVTKLPNGLASVLVAHVRGDVVSAALGIAEARSAFRVAAFHADPPHILMRELNYLMRTSKEHRLLDAAIVVMNPKSGAAEVCTAGDIGVISVDEDGEPRVWTELNSPPAGTHEQYEYARKQVRLADGATLAVFSSGCQTAADRHGQVMGRSRVVDAVCDGFGRPAMAAMDEVLADLAPFLKDGRTPDDITLLLLHRPVSPV